MAMWTFIHGNQFCQHSLPFLVLRADVLRQLQQHPLLGDQAIPQILRCLHCLIPLCTQLCHLQTGYHVARCVSLLLTSAALPRITLCTNLLSKVGGACVRALHQASHLFQPIRELMDRCP